YSIPAKDALKKTVVYIKIGQQIFSGRLATLLFTGMGIYFFLKIRFDALSTGQFQILFGSKDNGVANVKIAYTDRIYISVHLRVVGIFGNDALRVFHHQFPQSDTGAYRVYFLRIYFLPVRFLGIGIFSRPKKN